MSQDLGQLREVRQPRPKIRNILDGWQASEKGNGLVFGAVVRIPRLHDGAGLTYLPRKRRAGHRLPLCSEFGQALVDTGRNGIPMEQNARR